MSTSNEELEKHLAPYLTVQTVIGLPLSTLSVMFFVYGIYTMVFGLSIHTLLRKQNSAPSKLYIWCTVVLFLLATLYISAVAILYAYQSALTFNTAKSKDYTAFVSYLRDPSSPLIAFVTVAINICDCLMNLIMDCMLIHRCYVVWDFNYSIVYPFAFFAFILNGLNVSTDLILAYDDVTRKAAVANSVAVQINFWNAVGIAVFTLALAIVTGGRIWWISHRARQLVGMPSHPQYNAIVQIIIESGLLYSAFLVTTVVLLQTEDPHDTGVSPFDLAPVTTLISGLAPTLIIVRVAYGASVNSVQQVISTLHFAEGGGETSTRGSTTVNGPPHTEDVSIDLEGGAATKKQ